MTPADYQRVRDVFHGACERPPGERTAYLDGACGNDAELREQVSVLLEAATRNSHFMAQAPTTIAALSDGLANRNDDVIPAAIGGFRIIRLLGTGGMGAAYEAQQENPSRRVAIKTIRPGLGSPALLKRFTHEAHVLGRLRHAGIAQVYEAGIADGPLGSTPYIVMELVNGSPLDRWIATCHPSRSERLELLARVCDAVQHAHGKLVVHRDLKPANIMVEHNAPKVLDFGVARILDPGSSGTPVVTLATAPGTLVGTLAYMSPEQVTGGAHGVDARADVFALGVILFELLTDRLPRDLEGKAIAEAARVIRDDEPLRAGTVDRTLRGDLTTICGKAMERDPSRRYQTAAELAMDLRRYLGHEPIIARPATLMYQLRKFTLRHTGFVIGTSIAVVALLLGITLTTRYAILASEQRDRALTEEAAARWTTYKLSIAAAQESVRTNPARARAKLTEAPASLRNWEWRHLAARLEQTETSVASDPGIDICGAFTPSGAARAAVVRGPQAELVDVDSGALVGAFDVPAYVSGVLLSRDAGTLAAWSRRARSIIVHDTRTRSRRFEHTNTHDVLAIGLSPDGTLLGIVLARRGILVYDTVNGSLQNDYNLNVLSARNGLVEFNAGNSHLVCSAIASDGSQWLSLYDLSQPPPMRGFEEAAGAAFDPAGGLLATGTIKGIHLHTMPAGHTHSHIHGRMRIATRLAFSGDGQRLAGFVGKESVHVWSIGTGEMECALSVPDTTTAIAMSHSGDRVLIGSEGRVILQSLAETGISVLRGHTNYVYLVAWSGDGNLVASAGWDGTVRVWDADTGMARAVLTVQPTDPLAPVDGLAFSADGSSLLVLTHANELIAFELAELALPQVPATQEQSHSTTRAPHTQTLDQRPPPQATGEAAISEYWVRSRPGAKRVVNTGGEPHSSSPAEPLPVRTAQVDGSDIIVSDRATGQQVRRISLESSVKATAFCPDGMHLAASTSDPRIRIHHLNTGAVTAELRDHESSIYTITFTPDGARMASGDGDGLILIWDTAHWEKIAELVGHTSYVHSLAYSPDGLTLCSGSGDGTVRLWRSTAP